MFDATIIIATWNTETIERSIASAFAQTGITIEVIVVDDASTDGTYKKLSNRTDITFERLPVNGGPAQARNRALDLAQGDWIAVLDADDTMVPHRLANMISQAKKTSADIILGNFRKVDEVGVEIEELPFLSPSDIDPEQCLTLEHYVGRNQVSLGTQSIGFLKPILSRKYLAATSLRYNPSLRNGEDCHLIFSALMNGAKVVISPSPDYLYTVRPGSISYRADPNHLEALIAADDAFLFRHAAKVSSETRLLFESRKAGLTEMMVSERILAMVKSGRILGACKMLVKSPRIIGRVTHQILEGLGRRIKTG